jgi:hypothetical protein
MVVERGRGRGYHEFGSRLIDQEQSTDQQSTRRRQQMRPYYLYSPRARSRSFGAGWPCGACALCPSGAGATSLVVSCRKYASIHFHIHIKISRSIRCFFGGGWLMVVDRLRLREAL